MKIKILVPLLFAVLVFSGCTSTSIASQEKCSKGAKEFFDNYNPPGGLKDTYSNHYNQKLDKCFILVKLHIDGNGGLLSAENLYNVYDNVYLGGKGSFNGDKPFMCNFGNRNCDGNDEEYKKIIKPYMEE